MFRSSVCLFKQLWFLWVTSGLHNPQSVNPDIVHQPQGSLPTQLLTSSSPLCFTLDFLKPSTLECAERFRDACEALCDLPSDVDCSKDVSDTVACKTSVSDVLQREWSFLHD